MRSFSRLRRYIRGSDYLVHETKKNVLIRYSILVALLLAYAIFVSLKFGVSDGISITALTWSFFVFCTPIADAGFVLDFPLRVLLGVKMLHAELLVWLTASMLNIYALIFAPNIYNDVSILQLFHHILTNPIPMWSVIVVSAMGTFLSVHFADELIDVATHDERHKCERHKSKHRFIIMVFFIVLTLILYDFILTKLGVNISL